MKITPKDFQTTLMFAGFALPKYGADGDYGGETEAATDAWFDSGQAIEVYQDGAEPPPDIVPQGIVPPDWMPSCDMARIIVHWTAGAHKASENDVDHYHILVEGSGKLVRGTHSITDNVNTSDGNYAAHTKNKNTGSIGISACAMAGASENPFHAGQYPLLEEQWEVLAHVAADLCNAYGIPVTPTTVLQHGEVQENLGEPQDGKWDINVLPWDQKANAGDAFRQAVKRYL